MHMNTDSNKITRREAIKRMGLTLAGGLFASDGLSALASCTKEKKRIILYFTGTGNCLYTARQLADKGTELLSIPQMVKEGRYDFDADEIGLVYPIYGHMPPHMVREFIGKAKLNAPYRFAVLTYGARKCNAVEIFDDIATKAGNPFQYIGTLMMVDNWLPNFDMNEQMKMDKHIPENLARIRESVERQEQWHEPVTDEERAQHEGFMQYSGLDPEVGFLKKSEKYFAVTDACVQCGICTEVCPRGNWHLGAQGVSTAGDCEFCFACIQNCPQKAIQFAKDDSDPLLARGEKNPNARYRNEYISAMDIKRANSQV